jgi:hypothetical protein
MASTLMTWERNNEHENEDNMKLQNACNSPDIIEKLERLEDRRRAQTEPEVRRHIGRPKFK